MPFALPILLLVSLCLPISGNDVNNAAENTHALVAPTNRPVAHRNQTKTARNDQLLSLLASRRREIIQRRFRTHIKNIVDLSSGNTSSPLPKPITSFPNATKTLNVHLNLSDLLLRNSVGNNTEENLNVSSSTESNVVNVSSPRYAQKRKNVEVVQTPENKTKNMPIIRNILYRRKMSFLNRKLPLDLEQIAFDDLGLPDINKTPEDLILDNEDSLQVEESSHDKLIYYDVKNNASKKSGNNFEDSSDEIKSMSMNNKTAHSNRKHTNNTTTVEPKLSSSTTTKPPIVQNSTQSTIEPTVKNETEIIAKQNKNTTRFMSPTLYNYFRPLDVPEEEMQPFLRFGEKLPNLKIPRNQSKPVEKTTVKNEEEIHENMDVSEIKPEIFENKIAKINLPNQKSTTGRDYFKNRSQNKKNTTESTTAPKVDKKTYIHNYRNITRNRGFRNATIFVQNKRSGVRHTINLKGNSSIANLKPETTTHLIQNVTTSVTTVTPPVTSSPEIKITKMQNMQLNVNETQTIKIPEEPPEDVATVLPETTTEILPTTTTTEATTTTKLTTSTTTTTTTTTSTVVPTESTTTRPTTGVFSTAVVTSVSIESAKSRAANKTVENNQTSTTTDINLDFDATVIAALNNFTSQGFQNQHYPNISSSNLTNVRHDKKPFILRPTSTEVPTTTAEFIIHVPDVDVTLPEPTMAPEIELGSRFLPSVKISSRINFEPANVSTTTVPATKQTTTQSTTTTTSTTTSSSTTSSTTTTIPKRVFNTTGLSKPEPELELPLATLFSVTEFKKPEPNQNSSNKIYKASETVISRKSESDVSIDNVHAAYILAALGFLPMMVIVIYVVRSVMKKKPKLIEDYETEMHDSEKKSIIHPVARLPTLVLDPSNRWEFPRSKLRLQTLLGQGNFGQVWKAEADDLKGHVGLTRLVAVKTIKDGAGSKERDDLLKELAIMQKMGSHPNVVTLLGCCTDKEPYLLIMEYVMYGKLLTFLRDHRTRRDYYNFSDDAATLTARDLTVFAYCVARGMDYLSSKGIIHRDLAARNILVDHNKLCKIADFGMSRDATGAPGGEVAEPRAPRNALPVRWMAVESLLYSVFTHKSDVWAFGVLLWEIVTLGSSPYANMSGREVMRLVCAGYRLERPGHCRPELYGVMARCWVADPGSRPTFADLRDDLAALMEQPHPDGSYVDLESFRADPTVYEIDNCTPRGNYFTVKSRFSEFECEI